MSPVRIASITWMVLINAAVVLATVPAFAQVPEYDTARRCAEFAKGSRTVANGCRRDESRCAARA
jgi:hypothetical protein